MIETPEQRIVDEAITSRHSIRAFLPTPVAREDIERMLDVAARAPSGYQMIYLRDPNYSFDRADSLIALLGLGHDLGKI